MHYDLLADYYVYDKFLDNDLLRLKFLAWTD